MILKNFGWLSHLYWTGLTLLNGFSFFVNYFLFSFGSCSRLSWLNCQLSSDFERDGKWRTIYKYSVFTYLFTYFTCSSLFLALLERGWSASVTPWTLMWWGLLNPPKYGHSVLPSIRLTVTSVTVYGAIEMNLLFLLLLTLARTSHFSAVSLFICLQVSSLIARR